MARSFILVCCERILPVRFPRWKRRYRKETPNEERRVISKMEVVSPARSLLLINYTLFMENEELTIRIVKEVRGYDTLRQTKKISHREDLNINS